MASTTMIRSLSKELQKIATEELNENSKLLEEDIKHIQEWIKQQPHLNAPIDKQWILTFLRGCKFSYQTTKNKFDMFYTIKSILPEFTKPKNVFSTEIQSLLKAGLILPLPYPENYQGPRVILFQFKNCDTSIINMETISSFLYMLLNVLMVEDDNVSVCGDLFLADMSHFPLSFVLQLTPSYLKNFFSCIQNAFPIRLKGIHIIGSPTLGEKIFNLIKAYMTPKLRDRVFVYSESNFENVYKYVSKSHLPKEYGGTNSYLTEIAADLTKKMESYSSWFAENEQYFTNENLRPEKLVSFEDVIGIDGSFRKLNLD